MFIVCSVLSCTLFYRVCLDSSIVVSLCIIQFCLFCDCQKRFCHNLPVSVTLT